MSGQSFMERFGPRLVANGYPILPIMPGVPEKHLHLLQGSNDRGH